MLKLAVLGKDVSQSQSPAMHTFLLKGMGVECEYDKISILPTQFSVRIGEILNNYDGLNITIPFKVDIIPYLNALEGDAAKLQSVNTVITATRSGYSTDGYGFLLMLENEGVCLKGKRVLVLGTGGAGRTCIQALQNAGATVFAFERDEGRLQEVAQMLGCFTPLYEIPFTHYDIILNCTGIGMHDTVGQTPSVRYEGGEVSPVDERLISLCDLAVDLIYVPRVSQFLKIALAQNKPVISGEAMLFYQAYMGDCIFLGRTPSAREAKELWTKFQEEQL